MDGKSLNIILDFHLEHSATWFHTWEDCTSSIKMNCSGVSNMFTLSALSKNQKSQFLGILN